MVGYQVSFWVVTLGTQHKLPDEPVQHVLQLVGLVGPVDDEAVVLGIELSLSSQLTAKKLGWVCDTEGETEALAPRTRYPPGPLRTMDPEDQGLY